MQFASRLDNVETSAIRELFKLLGKPGIISFAGGFPDSAMFDVEGLISSPYGPGRREHLLQMIDRYAADYPQLKACSASYPSPVALRRIAKQGARNAIEAFRDRVSA